MAEMPRRPSLQKLVEKYGGYDKITPELWDKYDAALKRWRISVNHGDHYLEMFKAAQNDER